MNNYLEYKDFIGYQGLGLILKIKNRILKIPYQILAKGMVYRIQNTDIPYLDTNILAETKEELDKIFQKKLINLYRKYLKNKNCINFKIQQFLENNFKLHYFSQILPKTSLNPLIYLSQYASLSIPYNNYKTGGDDYFDRTVEFERDFILCGEGLKINTNFIYGDMEIIDISDFLINQENIVFEGDVCYMATHHRAIVDLVLEFILANKSFEPMWNECRHIFIDDYLNDNEDIKKVIKMLEMAFPYLNQAQINEIKKWCNTYSFN